MEINLADILKNLENGRKQDKFKFTNSDSNINKGLTVKSPLKVKFKEGVFTDVFKIQYYIRHNLGYFDKKDPYIYYNYKEIVIEHMGYQYKNKLNYIIQNFYIHKEQKQGEIILTIYKNKSMKDIREIQDNPEWKTKYRTLLMEREMEELRNPPDEKYF